MSQILRLTIINFNNLENNTSDAIDFHHEHFCSDENGTAYKKINDYLKLQNIKLYLGHDLNVYPNFVVKEIYLR